MKDRVMRQPRSPLDHGDVAEIRSILELARRAPSVHNTQPWRWRIDGRVLELRADRSRQLRVADPVGRNFMISCGCAVHHAVVGAGALGWRASVDLLPEPADPDVLARMQLVPVAVPDDSRDVLRVIEDRRTDRRRFTNWPVPPERLKDLAFDAGRWGAQVVVLTDLTQRWRVEGLVERAIASQEQDGRYSAEQRAWMDRGPTDGIPERGPDRGRRSRRRASDAFHPTVDADDRPHDRGVRWTDPDRDDVGRTTVLAARGAGAQCALAGCRGRWSVDGPAQPGDRAQRDPSRPALRRDVREHGAADPGPHGVAGDRPCRAAADTQATRWTTSSTPETTGQGHRPSAGGVD